MIKNIFVHVTCLILFSNIIQAQITFQKSYGFAINGAGGTGGQQTSDGGYILIGYSMPTQTSGYGVELVKTDSNGDTVWTKLFEKGQFHRHGHCVIQTNDGGYMITGYATDTINMQSSFLQAIKTDANGDTIWTRSYRTSGWTDGHFGRQTTDGGYIFCGRLGDTISNGMCLIRTNANGDTLWTRIGKSPNSFSWANCVLQTNDGGFIVSGRTGSSPNNVNEKAFLIKTDANGDTVWTRTYFGLYSNWTMGYDVVQTDDGGFALTGFAKSFTAFDTEAFLIKTDSVGNVLWAKRYGGSNNDWAYSLNKTSDGGFILAGTTNSFNVTLTDAYLVKTDSIGNLIWSKTYGNSADQYFSEVMQLSNGEYMAVGGSVPVTNGTIYLVKTDSLGNSGCNETTPPTAVNSSTVNTGTAFNLYSIGATVSPTVFTVKRGVPVNVYCPLVGINEYFKDDLFTASPNPFDDELNVNCTRLSNASIPSHYPAQSSPNSALLSVTLYDIFGRTVLSQPLTTVNSKPACTAVRLETVNLSPGIYLYEIGNSNGIIKAGKVVKE